MLVNGLNGLIGWRMRMETRRSRIQTPYDELTYKIIGVAMAVHTELGPGFSEELYQRAMAIGLSADGVPYEREYLIVVQFRNQTIGKYELDFVADKTAVVELKALPSLAVVHQQQVIAYLAASGLPVGLLMNFGAARLEYKRIFPPIAVQTSAAYLGRKTLGS